MVAFKMFAKNKNETDGHVSKVQVFNSGHWNTIWDKKEWGYYNGMR